MNKNNIYLQIVNTTFRLRSVTFKWASLWNKFPLSIKNTVSINKFKKILKLQLLHFDLESYFSEVLAQLPISHNPSAYLFTFGFLFYFSFFFGR